MPQVDIDALKQLHEETHFIEWRKRAWLAQALAQEIKIEIETFLEQSTQEETLKREALENILRVLKTSINARKINTLNIPAELLDIISPLFPPTKIITLPFAIVALGHKIQFKKKVHKLHNTLENTFPEIEWKEQNIIYAEEYLEALDFVIALLGRIFLPGFLLAGLGVSVGEILFSLHYRKQIVTTQLELLELAKTVSRKTAPQIEGGIS